MDKYRFGKTTVLSFVLGLLTILDYSCAANVKNKEDFFNISITMPNFNTTQVKIKLSNFSSYDNEFPYLQDDQYAFVQYELPDEELTIGTFKYKLEILTS